jgi:deazaflavin-dependent oxidoreductase (nitroreductase family)
MPIPHRIARFNRRVTNPILGPIVVRLPGFGMLVHRGRRSGREFRTPVLSFRRGGGLVFALTYGVETDWVRNVLAAGSCDLVMRGRAIHLVEPRLFHDPAHHAVPRIVGLGLAMLQADDFLELRIG